MNNSNYSNAEVRRGDVFWCEFDMHHGCEQFGTRPVIVVSNDKCNDVSPIITAVSITSQKKKKMPTHTIVKTPISSVAMCEQIHTVDRSRLKSFVCHLTEDEMRWVDKCIKVQLGILDGSIDKQNFENDNAVEAISSEIIRHIAMLEDYKNRYCGSDAKAYYEGALQAVTQLKFFIDNFKVK